MAPRLNGAPTNQKLSARRRYYSRLSLASSPVRLWRAKRLRAEARKRPGIINLNRQKENGLCSGERREMSSKREFCCKGARGATRATFDGFTSRRK